MAAVVMDSPTSSESSENTIIGNDHLQNIKFDTAETKFGDNVISTQFIKELENFYNKADRHDKEKCLELITSVGLGEDLKRRMKKLQRCKTAMPVFGRGTLLNPYQTTYERDYPYKTGRQLWAIRPMTSVGYITTVPESQPLGPTVYDIEYCRKFQRPPSPERSATASGQRKNRPHPSQAFLVWKFPSKARHNQDDDCKMSQELTDEKLSQITKRLCHSVYQNDYLGIPQGFQVKSAFDLPSNWKEKVPYGLNTSQRQTYQLPHQMQELTVPTTRYGSNSQKETPSMSIIPTANKRLNGIGSRTTYDRHYNDNAGLMVEQIRNADKKLEAVALKKILMNSGHDNVQIGKILEGFEEPEIRTQSLKTALPVPPASSRSFSAPLTTQRNKLKSSLQNVYGISPQLPANHIAQAACSANISRFSVSPPKPITLPSKSPFHVQMPTTPLSVPYTPPVLLS